MVMDTTRRDIKRIILHTHGTFEHETAYHFRYLNEEIVPANLFFGDFVSLISLSRWQFESDSVPNQKEIKF